jgi:hypothetical protein
MMRSRDLLSGLVAWVLTCTALGLVTRLLPDANASLVEVIWTGTALCGLGYAVRVLQRRRRIDRERRRLKINGLLAIISTNYVRSRWIALVVQILNTLAGLAAMVAPQPLRAEVTVYAVVSSAALLTVGVLTAFSSWQSERMLVQQLDYATRQRQRDAEAGRKIVATGYVYERERGQDDG